MMKLKYALMMVLGVSVAANMIGCEAKDQAKSTAASKGEAMSKGGDHDHDHDDHKPAASLKEALETIEKYRAEIKEAFSKKQPEDAHEALHEVGHSLESITNLAGATTEEEKQSVKKAVDELFECFGAMDETLHGETGKSYHEVADRIDTALAVLKGMAK